MATHQVPDETIVVSKWTATSAYGRGADSFTAGLGAGRTGVTELDHATWRVPYTHAALIPGFDVADVLGAKGTRAMDRLTGIVVATVGTLLDESGLWNGDGDGGSISAEDVGLVVGTSGSVQSIWDFTWDTFTGDKPYHVDPARFPNGLMNRPAGQSAIWYGLKGPNVTVVAGATTGLLALRYAVGLLRSARCAALLCGAAEEFSTQRSWLASRLRDGEAMACPLGEGCAMFLLEPATHARRYGRRPLASVLGTRFVSHSGSAGMRETMARCTTEALASAGVDAARVRLVATSDIEGLPGKEEQAALADVLRPEAATSTGWERLETRRLIGDTASAAGALQLAAVLAAVQDRPALDDTIALVTSLDPTGDAGCAVLRIYPEGRC
jgi:3-oxoacyl-[acyl-carrier-protein] synthase II